MRSTGEQLAKMEMKDDNSRTEETEIRRIEEVRWSLTNLISKLKYVILNHYRWHLEKTINYIFYTENE